jgi:hypothetical protein
LTRQPGRGILSAMDGAGSGAADTGSSKTCKNRTEFGNCAGVRISQWQNEAPTHLAGVSKGISGAQRKWPELAQYSDCVKFSVACPCGSNVFRLEVRLDEENVPTSPPVQISCVGCNKRKLL